MDERAEKLALGVLGVIGVGGIAALIWEWLDGRRG